MTYVKKNDRAFPITTSREIKIMVQLHLKVENLSIKSREPINVFGRYIICALAIKYAAESNIRIAANIGLKQSHGVTLGARKFYELKDQKLFKRYSEIFDLLDSDLALRKVKRKEKKKSYGSMDEIEKEYRLRIWKMGQHHHSIRKKLTEKVKKLETEIQKLRKNEQRNTTINGAVGPTIRHNG